MARRLRGIGFVVLALLAPAASAQAAAVNVTVDDDFFKPTSVQVHQGDTVTWQWAASTSTHNVRSTTPAGVPDSPDLSDGASWSHTFTEAPGTYSYVCTRHESKMKASVTVVGTDTTPPPAPTATPRGGTYRSTQSVTLSDSESGVTIRYTADGSTPTTSSTAYSSPISVSSSRTIKAIAVHGA